MTLRLQEQQKLMRRDDVRVRRDNRRPETGAASAGENRHSKGKATDEDSVTDGNFYTAKDEHTIRTMLPKVVEELKK